MTRAQARSSEPVLEALLEASDSKEVGQDLLFGGSLGAGDGTNPVFEQVQRGDPTPS